MSSKKTGSKILNHLPEVLSVRGAISPSPAVFNYREDSGETKPIKLNISRGVGTFGSYAHQYIDGNKKAESIENANPFHCDVAYMPSDSDTLVAKVTVVFDKCVNSYEAFSDHTFAANMNEIMESFIASPAGSKLASLYVDNILKCQWLFRNRKTPSKTVDIKAVTCINENVLEKAFSFSSVGNDQQFSGPEYDELVELVRKSLAGETDSKLILSVTASLLVGFGAQIFPSQAWEGESDEKSKDTSKDKKTKFLYTIPHMGTVTGMSPQKVGNGLRTIDTWHGVGEKAIPVNPYGQDRESNSAVRMRSSGNDFYGLLNKLHDNLEETVSTIKNAKTADDVPGNIYFVVANMVRGGVFGTPEKKEDKK